MAASKPKLVVPVAPATDTAEAKVIWCTHEHGLAIVKNVAVFRDEVTPAPSAVYALRDQLLLLGKEYPEAGVVLFYVSPDVEAEYPDEPTRAAFLDLLRSSRGVLRGTVYSVLRGGLMGVTVRALARAILHAARVGESSAVVSSLDEAGAWAEARSLARAADLISTWHQLGIYATQPSGARPAQPPPPSSRPPSEE
ncbi:MAG: hypothetical protein U0174_05935 [Polyangiaceae bacterium]